MFPPPLSIAPQFVGKSRAARNFLTAPSGLLICALFLLVGLAVAGDYGIGFDELPQRRIALANLNYILGQGDSLAALPDVYPLYGVAFELPLLLAERGLGLEDYHQIHRLRLTLTHLFFIIGAFFCYRLACHLFPNRLLALFALLIFLLHPRIYGHSFVGYKDAPFLSMFVIALYLLERAFRRDTLGAFILLGIAVGLLTNLRIMGIMLLAAVLAMRGLDLFYAGNGMERKRILLSGGVFIMAAGLTLYAATPYAWANPVDYLAASLNLTVNHPVVYPQLFQGRLIFSDELPPHYNAVWFAITTPPLIMLLGGIGAAAVAARLCRRPGAVFPNTRRRFLALLLAAFLLPPLAVALLGGNQYDTWRHLHFVYVPFCLLAAGGLGGLAATLARRRPGTAGVYGLAGLGVGLIAFQMIQLHPLQYSYFNFLVDRTTPEYLRTQYPMDPWYLVYRQGLEQLLERHPDEALVVATLRRYRDILPPGRLHPPGGAAAADYELIFQPEGSQPDLAFNAAYRRRLYNNTLLATRPLDSARMTPAARAAYREIYNQAVAGEPIIHADYNVYRQGQRLTFVKENCPPDSRDVWFSVKLFPPDPEPLAPPAVGALRHLYPHRLSSHRVQLGELCLAVIQLPAAARGDIILAQRQWGLGPAEVIWEELYSLAPPGLRERMAQWPPESPPAGPAAFEVFLDPDAGGYRLLYAKKNCAQSEYETRIILHIYPERRADLPARHRARGFDNRDFHLTAYGGRPGGECLAVVYLPRYPIAAIRTGQAGMWETHLYPPADPEQLRAMYVAVAGRPPAAQADFALYLRDNQLIYWRETCADADTAAKFRLHIIPRDAADLPAEGQANGYANLDFDFGRWGGSFDGQCLAAVPLPEYPIAAIRTGQAGGWEVNLYLPADPELLRATYAALAGRQPDTRSNFDLYLQDNQLIYLRESCAAADTAAGFFLYIAPEDPADLPADRRRAGFIHRDFDFARWGGPFDGKCLAAVPLPDFPVAALRTGQAGRWQVNLYPPTNPAWRRADYAALAGVQPAARNYFDLYWQDNRLTYRRETCAAADTAAGFFLHILPVDVADLPAERRTAGFANRDFAFAQRGAHFDGKCLAAVALPDYPIREIRTGQYIPGQGALWAAELTVER